MSRPAALGAALDAAIARLAGRKCPEPRADAEVLLARATGIPRPRLVLERDAPLGARAREAFDRMLARRLRREPVAYITGEREFWSLPFAVTRAVLIPRPETETLVEEALALLEGMGKEKALVLDLGTGSGCVAVALASERPRARIVAIDRSARALDVAARNAARHGVARRVRFLRGDLFRAGPMRRADLIVSNPPYVADAEWRALPPEIRAFEPRMALHGGKDGLAFYRRIARDAPARLGPRGWLAVEVGEGQSERVAELLLKAGRFTDVRVRKDLAGTPRVVSARRV